MEPGSKSTLHEHKNFEEFYILDGELIDPDNKIFTKGDLVTYEPGSTHSSYTKKGSAVISSNGLVGRVVSVSSDNARVMLFDDVN